MSDSGRVIPVEICGQRYPIRTTLDPEYVSRLANYVDEKMRAAGESAPTGDPQRLAVLAALNIADELFRAAKPPAPGTAKSPSGPGSSNAWWTASSSLEPDTLND